MVFHHNERNGPVMKAAQMALATGNTNYVLIRVPEESENILKICWRKRAVNAAPERICRTVPLTGISRP
jgi:hypothetical protein